MKEMLAARLDLSMGLKRDQKEFSFLSPFLLSAVLLLALRLNKLFLIKKERNS